MKITFNKRVFICALVLIFVFSISAIASAYSTAGKWAVNSKSLDYDRLSPYGLTGSIDNAINKWDWTSSAGRYPKFQMYGNSSGSLISISNSGSNNQCAVTTRVILLGVITTARIDLNSYYCYVGSKCNVEAVMLHELGHFLGLNHSYSGTVMYPDYTGLLFLTEDDLKGDFSLYGYNLY